MAESSEEKRQRSLAMFGVDAFEYYRRTESRNWIVFSNREHTKSPSIQNEHLHQLRFFHGATLSQCHIILPEGFQVGLHRRNATRQHPSGIWGCTHPSMALDRAPLTRGWSINREPAISAWDTPVAICWDVNREDVKICKEFRCGELKMVIRYPVDQRVEILDSWARTEIWIQCAVYKHFATLQNCWPQLKDGTIVACRSRERDPDSLYRCGDAHPMTCGRATYAHQLRTGCWRWAQGSREWICPACYVQQLSCQPTFKE